MNQTIRKCISNFGDAPRRFSLLDRLTYLQVSKPAWLRSNPTDKLSIHFNNLSSVFTNGMITWGHVIQANVMMYEAGSIDCPGELVYSIEDAERVDTEHLQCVARELFRLKGTEPGDPKLLSIARYLTDERIRVFGLQVPTCISPLISYRISTTYFLRKHLPNGRLCSPLLPILVNPEEPHIVTPLPKRYWPQEFVEWWQK